MLTVSLSNRRQKTQNRPRHANNKTRNEMERKEKNGSPDTRTTLKMEQTLEYK